MKEKEVRRFVIDFYCTIRFSGRTIECYGAGLTTVNPLLSRDYDPDDEICKEIMKYFRIPKSDKVWTMTQQLNCYSGIFGIPRGSPLYHKEVYANP